MSSCNILALTNSISFCYISWEWQVDEVPLSATDTYCLIYYCWSYLNRCSLFKIVKTSTTYKLVYNLVNSLDLSFAEYLQLQIPILSDLNFIIVVETYLVRWILWLFSGNHRTHFGFLGYVIRWRRKIYCPYLAHLLCVCLLRWHLIVYFIITIFVQIGLLHSNFLK